MDDRVEVHVGEQNRSGDVSFVIQFVIDRCDDPVIDCVADGDDFFEKEVLSEVSHPLGVGS